MNSFRAKLRALLEGIIWMQASICAVYTIVTGKRLRGSFEGDGWLRVGGCKVFTKGGKVDYVG